MCIVLNTSAGSGRTIGPEKSPKVWFRVSMTFSD